MSRKQRPVEKATEAEAEAEDDQNEDSGQQCEKVRFNQERVRFVFRTGPKKSKNPNAVRT